MQRSARVAIRVQPRSSRNEIAGERAGAIVVKVTAPPVSGRANDAVRKLIAKRAGVAPSAVTVVRGSGGRDKLIQVMGLSEAQLRRKLWSEPPS